MNANLIYGLLALSVLGTIAYRVSATLRRTLRDIAWLCGLAVALIFLAAINRFVHDVVGS